MHEVIMHKIETAFVRVRSSYIIISSSMFKNCVPVLVANVRALNTFSAVWKEKYFFSPVWKEVLLVHQYLFCYNTARLQTVGSLIFRHLLHRR